MDEVEPQWFAPLWLSCLEEKFSSGAMLFNPCTGTTHHLDDLSLWIMAVLSRQSASVATLAKKLGSEDPDTIQALNIAVGRLAESKLLSRWEV